MKDLVSVIMPSYNTAAYIGASIRSVLAQTYENWELLIVDDCSTDQTDAMVASFSDPRIRYLKNERNSGAAVSRNRALREARGEWIAFLDSDDLWAPEKLEKQLAFMRERSCRFSCTACEVVNEQTEPVGRIYKSPRRVGKLGMYLYCWPSCLTVMYHAPTVGLVQIEDLKKNNDYAMWLKVVRKCDCFCLDEVLAQYRVRSGSISHDRLKKLIRSHYDLYRKGEEMNMAVSLFLTGVNMVFGVCKKLFFVRRVDGSENS